ncbi:hypothetical protein HMPREF1551_01018 [Capnocytophaga sp. oral taxon 863 str. F0517]|nr:hypothetical protein [Capnocytophaga sp. oral taxon 863]ERI63629.1 hypothetical protein HMPREF1551_01018 [Capnocytophaga sp. oral taxon 863 str. F0517]
MKKTTYSSPLGSGQWQPQKIQAELFKMTKSKKCITCLFCIGNIVV